MYSRKLIMVSFILGAVDILAIEDNGPLVLEPMKIPNIIANPTPLYVGLGFTIGALSIGNSKLDFTHKAKKGQSKVGALSVWFGYDIHKRIAIEGRYMNSFLKEKLANIQNISFLLKPHFSLTDEMSAYALFGYGRSILTEINHRKPIDIIKSGTQWGYGLEYDSTETMTYFVDYTNLLQKVKNFSADVLTLGIKYRF